MVRTPLTPDERERGALLGRALQRARGPRSAADVARHAGISLDTLRKIERGAIPTPTFFTVAALARVLALDLRMLADLPPATPGRVAGLSRPAAATATATVAATGASTVAATGQ